MTSYFKANRSDGRSDRVVVYDLAHKIEPDSLLSFDDLLNALKEGLDKENQEKIDKTRVYRAVGAANRELLKNEKRYLAVVRGKGYKMIKSKEHLPLAMQHKRKSQNYMKRGYEILKHTRMDELTDEQRKIHIGQQFLITSLYESIKASEIRHDQNESAITKLIKGQKQIMKKIGMEEDEMD